MKKKYAASAVLAKGTILGTVFECTNCKKRFIAGSKGMSALTERVTEHAGPGHYQFPAINPKVGMVFQGLPDMPYTSDQKPRDWYDKVVKSGGMLPAWDLVKV